ncbi:MAG TPA: NADH-quinone oxidoreductase subunit N [Candidatus Dormibacteraeota bacterium]|nr:NADH-quinone oxidoreductase subunit N [Candidatus Dormibacteraeota bacterium]
MTPSDLGLGAQEVIFGTVVALLLTDAFLPERRKALMALVAGAGILLSLALAVGAVAAGLSEPGNARLLFNQTVAVDSFAIFFEIVFLVLALLVLMLAPAYLDRRGVQHGEFYILLVAALAGMMLMVSAASLMTIFIGIELLSIALYVLSAFLRQEERSQEAGLKYLLMGGFASGFLLYGMALIYGATGSTSLTSIARALHGVSGDSQVFGIAGIGLVMVGLAFKSSAAPFHAWTPDVYEGAPAPVVAFMSVGTKIAAIAVFLRLFAVSFGAPAVASRWTILLGAVAAVSMLVGAVGALRQQNLKRMLAYSSVAQAGYLLLGAVAANRAGMVGGLYYLAAYATMTFGAFAVITLLARADRDGAEISTLRGLGYQQRAIGLMLALFMLALAGIPPTAGFMGKLFVFVAAVKAGYAGLAVVAAVASAISLYYYLRVVLVIYSPLETSRRAHPVDPLGTAAVLVAGVLTLVLGIFPALLYDFAARSSLL